MIYSRRSDWGLPLHEARGDHWGQADKRRVSSGDKKVFFVSAVEGIAVDKPQLQAKQLQGDIVQSTVQSDRTTDHKTEPFLRSEGRFPHQQVGKANILL